MRSERRLAVLDLETDPFEFGRVPMPFAACVYDGSRLMHFWGDDCLERLFAWLDEQPPMLIYAHNGGRFDFFYLLHRLGQKLRVISGRIVQATLGRHELRDSFAIIPVPLAQYQKTEIDYRRFERDLREIHRVDIQSYLTDDCVSLYDLVRAFHERFGRKLTVASTAIKELSQHHPLEKLGPAHDGEFRRFYHGGRVECFETGVRRGRFIVADVNSMYPHVMRAFDHPIGAAYRVHNRVNLDDPALMFACVDATSAGALPVRTRDGLSFPIGRGRFDATAHELRAATDVGWLTIHRVYAAWYCTRSQRFDAFVDAWNAEKVSADQRGDKIGRLFAKFMLNSAYGKFGQNPADFHDYTLRRPGDDLPRDAELYSDFGFVEIWRRKVPPQIHSYYDVAVAASVTGAARAELLRALAGAVRPLYCDTDSIICEKLAAPQHPTALGAWKIETEADTVAIGGKKLYACRLAGEWVKSASKGVAISEGKILDIARGKVHTYRREAPSFTLKNRQRFITRKVRGT